MNWKTVRVPELSYEAIKAYAEAHNLAICKVMQKLLFEWTMNFWSDPSRFGVDIHKGD